MPTKRNWAGEQQEYYPAGSSKGGEYAAGSGLGGAKFNGEKDFNSPYEQKYGKLSAHTLRLIENGDISDPRLNYEEEPQAPKVDMEAAKRENTSLYLLDQYYKGKMDLDTLHNELLKAHGGNIKSAFEWLLKNARK